MGWGGGGGNMERTMQNGFELIHKVGIHKMDFGLMR